MKILLQRVKAASVVVSDKLVAEVGLGLLVFVGFCQHDDVSMLEPWAHRILRYRIFPDQAGKMNLDVMQAAGGVLLVPQFTLSADTEKGLRPGFSTAATPSHAKLLFEQFAAQMAKQYRHIRTGVFGVDMDIASVNWGPVTFFLQSTSSSSVE